MEPFTLAEQEEAASALRTLCRVAPDLPAALHAVGPVAGANYAHGLTVSIHNDPPAFEAWREALALDPEQLTGRPINNDVMAVTGVVRCFGVPIELVGYLPLPAELPDAAA